jgi:hypothetical protein
MIPYLAAFSLPVLLYPIRRYSRMAYVFLLAGLWAMFAGLRNGIGGGDFYAYQQIYAGIVGFYLQAGKAFEPLFSLLCIAAKAAGIPYNGLLSIVALLIALPSAYVIDRRSEESALALFVFGIEWFLYVSFVVLRQGLAVGFSFLAIDFLLDKRWRGAVIAAAIAIGFHYSAIMLVPLFFCTGRLRNRTRLIFFLVAAAIFGVFELTSSRMAWRDATQGLFNRFLTYVSGGKVEPLNLLNYLEIGAVWLLIERYAEDAHPLLKNGYFVYSCCALAAMRQAIVIRFAWYPELALALLIPAICEARRVSRGARILLYGGLTAYFLAKTCRWLLLNGGGLGGFLPYSWIL